MELEKKYINILKYALLALNLPLSFLSFILPVFGRWLASSPVQIGLFYTSFSIITLLARPFIGILTDKFWKDTIKVEY